MISSGVRHWQALCLLWPPVRSVVLWSGAEWPTSVMQRHMPRSSVWPFPGVLYFDLRRGASLSTCHGLYDSFIFGAGVRHRHPARGGRHGALALGLVPITFIPGMRVDLTAYLFGDILAVSHTDLVVICLGAVFILVLLRLRGGPLLLLTLNTDLAGAPGEI
ncbi:MAG: hypothetical protein CM1200mP20_05450 [Pseudomonadota bacterium]|nr:MAG: hypothetical protein CM1200mP20_05450 [Pseudomonadota bacterium]